MCIGNKRKVLNMKYEDIIEKMREKIAKKDVTCIKNHLAYQFNITGEGEGVFYLEVSEGKAHVEPYDYHDRDACFICSAKVLFDMMEGMADPVDAFTKGELQVEGDLEKALMLKEFI